MSQYSSILRRISFEKFSEVLAAAPRQAKEGYFHRHSIKAPKTSGLPKSGAKNEARLLGLFDVFQHTVDEEMAEDILRRWLLTKRTMLALALDHLNIPHEEGLTDSEDIENIAKMSAADIQSLLSAITASFPKEDAVIYLQFMGVENIA